MRREWIEIFAVVRFLYPVLVSPSMRREWIEMDYAPSIVYVFFVSLHAEGVD